MAPVRIRRVAFVLAALTWLFVVHARARAAPEQGSWTWPVLGPVIRGFEPPPSPFSAGHRGIDIGVRFGSPVVAPASGEVTFAGSVAGSLFVTIDHGDGYRSTSSWVSWIFVKPGDLVQRGEVIALSGRGHPELPQAHLHFGVRVNGTYIDPLLLLEPAGVVDVIRLGPMADDSSSFGAPLGSRAPPPRMSSFDEEGNLDRTPRASP